MTNSGELIRDDDYYKVKVLNPVKSGGITVQGKPDSVDQFKVSIKGANPFVKRISLNGKGGSAAPFGPNKVHGDMYEIDFNTSGNEQLPSIHIQTNSNFDTLSTNPETSFPDEIPRDTLIVQTHPLASSEHSAGLIQITSKNGDKSTPYIYQTTAGGFCFNNEAGDEVMGLTSQVALSSNPFTEKHVSFGDSSKPRFFKFGHSGEIGGSEKFPDAYNAESELEKFELLELGTKRP